MHTICIRVIHDPDKAKRNLAKHGVRLSDAEPVLFDPPALTVEDMSADGEQRHITFGMDALGRDLVDGIA